MNTNVVRQHPTVSAKIKCLPAVSIFLPLHASISPKIQLEHKLKLIVEKVESSLSTLCPQEKAAAIVHTLKALISTLNYNTHKKSIAIFVSPVLEKVYYLEGEVEERIDIDEFFETGGHVFKTDKKYSISLPQVKNMSDRNYNLIAVN